MEQTEEIIKETEAKAPRRRVPKKKPRKKGDAHERDLKRRREKYKPIHRKNLKKRQNARAYKKRRKAFLAEKKAKGDVFGFYRVVTTRNRVQTGEVGTFGWMLNAMDAFNDYAEKHNSGVICEKRYVKATDQPAEEFHEEVLLLKRIDPEVDDGVRAFRNEDGMFVDHIISNNKKYAIIAKSDVYTPETYHVYGYSPLTDKKTGRWIFDNIVNRDCSRDNFKSVFMLNNKLIVKYNDDFDMVICKNSDECARLYEGLRVNTDRKNKFVAYTGFVVNSMKSRYYDMIEEKTGWPRSAIVSTKT